MRKEKENGDGMNR